jgi:hypothetical protein
MSSPIAPAPGLNAKSSIRGVLVLFEGLPPTVIDSQVLAHVRLVREWLKIDLAVVAVACSREIFNASQSRLERARAAASGEVHLVRGVRPALPGSIMINRMLLGRMLDRLGAFSFLHARADYAAAVAGPWGSRRGVSTLWDCRGDSVAELQERLAGRAPLLLRYRSRLLEAELRLAGQTSAAVCSVTPQLRELVAKFTVGQPNWVIPCLAPEAEFYFDAALRARVRESHSIAPDEVVYVYSGALSPYQRFDETVVTFRAALTAGQKARLIVLTPDVERAQQICAGLPVKSVICRSVPHAEVNGYLNAADFGMLLRDSTRINAVAFPTKFAEYAMTGLKVIMKESPPACVAVARELGNYVRLGTQPEPWPASERARCAALAAQQLGRAAAMSTYAEIYSRLTQAGP